MVLTIIEIYKALRSLKYFELWFTTKPLGSIPSVISGILCIIPHGNTQNKLFNVKNKTQMTDNTKFINIDTNTPKYRVNKKLSGINGRDTTYINNIVTNNNIALTGCGLIIRSPI